MPFDHIEIWLSDLTLYPLNVVSEVRLDKPDGDVLSALTFDTKDWAVFYNDAETDGKHDLFFVFDGEFDLDEWQFAGK